MAPPHAVTEDSQTQENISSGGYAILQIKQPRRPAPGGLPEARHQTDFQQRGCFRTPTAESADAQNRLK